MSTSFLKKYKVLGKVGEGSFSEVLKCQDRETGVLYAAKRLKKVKESITEALKTPEVVAMRKLKHHPNILQLIESHFDPFPGKVTLIFELMDMSLYDMLKNRKRCLPETRVKNYLYQLVKAVDHLHRHGLFHRDIKPENILVKNDLIKLADLGSVRGIFGKPPFTEYISTRWYRSPECLLTTGYYGPKMDVWATGCVFFELLTLKPLFPGANETDQVNRIHNILGTPHNRLISKFRRHKSRNCEFYFPMKTGSGVCALLPNVSENGRDILKLMLTYDPESRPNMRRLMEHRYFNDLRDDELIPRRRSWSVVPSTLVQTSATEWRNPALLSYMTSEKRKKSKRTSTNRRKIELQKVPRVVVSSPVHHQTNKPSNAVQQLSNDVTSHVANVKQQYSEIKKSWQTMKGTSMLPKPVKGQQMISDENIFHLPSIPSPHNATTKMKASKPQCTLVTHHGPSTITSLPAIDQKVKEKNSSSTRPEENGM